MSSPPPPPDSLHSWAPYVSVIVVVAANVICYLCNDNSFVSRLVWLRKGRSSFFASNTNGGIGWKHTRPREFWAFDALDPEHLVTSHFVNDWLLLGTHALTLLWLMISMVVEQAKNGPLRDSWMTFFTHWSLVLLSLAGGLGLLTQARYMWRCRQLGRNQVQALASPSETYTAVDVGPCKAAAEGPGSSGKGLREAIRWDWLSISYLLSMETAVIAAFFLDVYFWAVLVAVQDYTVASPSTYLKHAGNLGIAFLEVFLTRIPMVSVHMQVVIAYATGYAVMVWIYGGVSDVWRYGLNWGKVSAVLTFAAIPIALTIFMILWWGIALLREKLGEAVRNRAVKRTYPGSVRFVDDGAATAIQG